MNAGPPCRFRTGLACILAVGVLVCSASAGGADEPQSRARDLNNQGSAAYDVGNYSEAIARFTAAYKVYPDARILFNLAQAYRKRREYERALELYRGYLRNLPDAPNQSAVNELIAELEQIIAEKKSTDNSPPQGTAPTELPQMPTTLTKIEESRPWYSNATGWALVAGGVIGTGVGIGFLASANSLEDELSAASDVEMPGIRSDIRTRRNIGTIATIVGGIAVAAGVTIFIVSPRTVSRQIVPLKDLRLSLHLGSLALQGRF